MEYCAGRGHRIGRIGVVCGKDGEFEVLERRQGVNFRVNRKGPGDCFGEVSLMYSCPRSASVAATQDSVVWVLERSVFRCAKFMGLLFLWTALDSKSVHSKLHV